MKPRYILIGAGVVAALMYHQYKIRAIQNSLIHLSDAFVEHAEIEYQAEIDDEFDSIVEELDD